MGIRPLDIVEPSGDINHQVLLDKVFGDAVCMQRLPAGNISIGQAVAYYLGM